MMTAVEDLMTRNPITVTEDDDLAVAAAILLHQRIRHLPVERDGKLVGLLTQRDLLRAGVIPGAPLAGLTPVHEVMTREVQTVYRLTPLRRAAKAMLERKYGCLPVVEADLTLVGILTESDLVRFAAEVAEDLDYIDASITWTHE